MRSAAWPLTSDFRLPSGTRSLMLKAMNFSGADGKNIAGVTARELPDSVIQGTGTMADLIRSKDWGQTSLGRLEDWSETLIASVNAMLLSPSSFALYWGDELILLYNDVYRDFLSEKHPSSLGASGPAVWREAWPVIGPPIETARKHGIVTTEADVLIPVLIDGKLEDRWWSYSFLPVFEKGRIVGVSNPGSEQTTAVVASKKLQESEQRFRTIFDQAPIGISLTNPDGRLADCNLAYEKLTGFSREELRTRSFLDLTHDEHRVENEAVFLSLLRGEISDFAFEKRYMNADGREIWVKANGTLLHSEAGAQRQVLGIIENVDARRKTEAALLQSEKLAAVGRLASSISHEINNPLASVTNLLYIIRNNNNLDEIHEYIDLAERELRRVSIITNQAVRFHKESTHAAPFFCADLITDSLSAFQGRLINSRISLEKRKRAEHPVNCFGGEIRQVLSNLIGNAIDAMPLGGRLLLRSREATNWKNERRGLVITVADTGTGISPASLRKIFDPFFTTKGIGGTGLGLWVSCEIVERHNGFLRVKSSQREGASGTVFTLFLPFDSSTAEETR